MAIGSPYLTPINRITIADEIVNRLTNYILDMGLKPGDKLPPERELMKSLSVGRSSLREAIKTLSAVGAVESSVREGTFVGRGGTSILAKPLFWKLLLGERSPEEVIEARQMVEVGLAGLAAERATEEDVAAIALQLEKMQESQNNFDAYTRYDVGFHLAVAAAAHNRVMYQVLDTLRYVVRAWIGKNILDAHGKPMSFHEHVPILEAIDANDVLGARQAMEVHLKRASERLLVSVAEFDEEMPG